MTTITGKIQLTERISSKTKLPKNQVSQIIDELLEETKKSFLKGEDISLKGYFSLTRSKKKPSGISKFCDKHHSKVNDYKKANKGKGLAAFAGSPVFRKLSLETRNCSNCKTQKQKIAKSTKLLTRVNCKVSPGF
jgi:nucleoid DNA-binding protein